MVERFFEDVEIGEEVGPIREQFTLDRVRRFLILRPRLGGDQRFTDAASAKAIGLGGPIVPGPLLAGVMARVLREWAPNGRLEKLDLVFRRNVLHEMPVDVHGVVTDQELREAGPSVDVDVYIASSSGERVVTGNATVILPSR